MITGFEQELSKKIDEVYSKDGDYYDFKEGAQFARDFYAPLMKEAMEALIDIKMEEVDEGRVKECIWNIANQALASIKSRLGEK